MSLSAEEKIRLLEKRIVRLEEMVARGAMAQYLFCPSLNAWLPAQCDEEGRQVIDPSDLDTRYLLLAGGTMLGDLGMTSEKKLKWSDTEYIDNYDTLAGTYTGLRFKSRDRIHYHGHNYFWGQFYVVGTGAFMRFQEANQYIGTGYDFYWKCYDDVVKDYVDVLEFIKGNPPYMSILKAGDIYPVGNKVKNLGSVTNYFNNAYIEDIQCDRINPLVIATSLIPSVTETMNIGSAAKKWEDVFLNLPTTDPEVVGQLWNDMGGGASIVRVSAGPP